MRELAKTKKTISYCESFLHRGEFAHVLPGYSRYVLSLSYTPLCIASLELNLFSFFSSSCKGSSLVAVLDRAFFGRDENADSFFPSFYLQATTRWNFDQLFLYQPLGLLVINSKHYCDPAQPKHTAQNKPQGSLLSLQNCRINNHSLNRSKVGVLMSPDLLVIKALKQVRKENRTAKYKKLNKSTGLAMRSSNLFDLQSYVKIWV